MTPFLTSKCRYEQELLCQALIVVYNLSELSVHSNVNRPAMYDVFISYAHNADRGLVPAIQSGLARVGKPWYRARSLRVFVDKTDLSAAPDLWERIESALSQSKWFVLVASPAAATSKWVTREVDRWVSLGRPDRFLIVLVDGDLAWPEGDADWNWEATDALPRSLSGVFKNEPLWVDVREIPDDAQFARDHGPLYHKIATIAATVHGVELSSLVSQDHRVHKRTVRLAWSIVALLSALLIIASCLGVWANRERQRANDQRRVAMKGQARYLAKLSEEVRKESAESSLLYALEAVQATRATVGTITLAAEQALRDSLSRVRGTLILNPARFLGRDRLITVSPSGNLRISTLSNVQVARAELELANIDTVTPSPDGGWIAVSFHGSPPQLKVFATKEGLVEAADLSAYVDSERPYVNFSPDSKWLALPTSTHIHIWKTDSLPSEPIVIDDNVARQSMLAFSPDGRGLVVHGSETEIRWWDLMVSPPRVKTIKTDGLQVVAFGTSSNRILLGPKRRDNVRSAPAVGYWAPSVSPPTFQSRSSGNRTLTGDTLKFRFVDRDGHADEIDLTPPRVKTSGFDPYPGNSNKSLILSPNGEYFAMISRRRVTICGATNDVRATVPGYLAAFSTNGQWVATAEHDTGQQLTPPGTPVSKHVIRLRDASNPGKVQRTIGEFDSTLSQLFLLNGDNIGQFIVAVESPGKVWSLEVTKPMVDVAPAVVDGRPSLEFPPARLPPRSIPHGRTVVRGANDLGHSIRVSPNGEWLVSSNETGNWLWSPSNGGDEPIRWPGPQGAPEVQTKGRSPDGFPMSSLTQGRAHGGLYGRIAFSPNGRQIAIASGGDGVFLRNLDNPNQRPTVLSTTHDAEVVKLESPPAIVYAPSGDWLAVAYDEARVSLWSLKGDAPTEMRLPKPAETVSNLFRSGASRIIVSSDGRRLAAAGAFGRINVWDTRSPKTSPLSLKVPEGAFLNLAFRGTTPELICTGLPNGPRIWNLSHPAEPTDLKGENPFFMAIVSDPNWIITAGQDAVLRRWNADGMPRTPVLFPGHSSRVLAMAASDDGRVVVTSGNDFAMRVWDMHNPGSIPQLINGRDFGALVVAVSPGGERFAAACQDGFVRLWSTDDVSRGPIKLPYVDHAQGVKALRRNDPIPWALQFDGSGRRLAVVNDGEVRVWRTAVDELVDLAMRSVGRNLHPVEWELAHGEEPYQLTVPTLGLPQGFVEFADRLAQTGAVTRAESLYRSAVRFDADLAIDPDKRVSRIASAGIRNKAYALARQGKHEAAVASYRYLSQLESGEKIDPEAAVLKIEKANAHEVAAEELIARGKLGQAMERMEQAIRLDPLRSESAKQQCAWLILRVTRRLLDAGDSDEFPILIKLIQEADELNFEMHFTGDDWNRLCKRGCQLGIAKEVVFAGDHAVTAAPYTLSFRETRGIARALSGDAKGAIADLRAHIKSAKSRNRSFDARTDLIDRIENGFRPSSIRELMQIDPTIFAED